MSDLNSLKACQNWNGALCTRSHSITSSYLNHNTRKMISLVVEVQTRMQCWRQDATAGLGCSSLQATYAQLRSCYFVCTQSRTHPPSITTPPLDARSTSILPAPWPSPPPPPDIHDDPISTKRRSMRTSSHRAVGLHS